MLDDGGVGGGSDLARGERVAGQDNFNTAHAFEQICCQRKPHFGHKAAPLARAYSIINGGRAGGLRPSARKGVRTGASRGASAAAGSPQMAAACAQSSSGEASARVRRRRSVLRRCGRGCTCRYRRRDELKGSTSSTSGGVRKSKAPTMAAHQARGRGAMVGRAGVDAPRARVASPGERERAGTRVDYAPDHTSVSMMKTPFRLTLLIAFHALLNSPPSPEFEWARAAGILCTNPVFFFFPRQKHKYVAMTWVTQC